MADDRQANDRFRSLRERAKELDCLYRVEELLADDNRPLSDTLSDIIATLPSGWQYPRLCQARIVYEDQVYESPGYVETRWTDVAPIQEGDRKVGYVEVSYTSELPAPSSRSSVFLRKERQLIRTIADRIGQTASHRKLQALLRERGSDSFSPEARSHHEWMTIVDLLRRTDEKLYLYVSRKMLSHLFFSGIKESGRVLDTFGPEFAAHYAEGPTDPNSPSEKQSRESILEVSDQVFGIAERHLNDDEILACLHKWIQENKLSFLIRAVDSRNRPLAQVVDAILRYSTLAAGPSAPPESAEQWLRVSLIRRFFSDSPDFIRVAKRHLDTTDFFDLVSHIIYPADSNGRLGGKSTGLFLAQQILRRAAGKEKLLEGIQVPKTWYLTADCMAEFLRYNELEDVSEQKYKELPQVRIEYPNIVQLFKHARFPADITKGISNALDDFGDRPIIVRSSSLLEDRVGTAFSGKYASLFLPNQGSKQDRLEALLDAIAEIYASVYGPDPILYRSEHGLLDFREEMGVMIQEVVGARVGPYHLPAFAGVAFSSNEFRWSPRLKREDGLVRLVPGLGTRAVDRVGDDYPVLLSPGQPALRVNVSPDEVRRYSPSQVDVINLENPAFQTVPLDSLLRQYGSVMPMLRKVVSAYHDGTIAPLSGVGMDPAKDELVATFDGLIGRTDFVKKMKAILLTLQEGLERPVDIEFASDGRNLYLLQCRAQCVDDEVSPSVIPQGIPESRTLFSAKRFISNGRVPDISHVVYVSPEGYARQPSLDALVDVGRAVGRLNALLPRRRFILMGPGRWGSRDIRQGVPVTYSDISNAAVLVEVAQKKGAFAPELSFGTHFFQDMIEAGIRYIPLYPGDSGVVFNDRFLNESHNKLEGLLPEYGHLSEVVRVIDVPDSTGGDVLRILMNADAGEAVGFFEAPEAPGEAPPQPRRAEARPDESRQWRERMAEQVASHLDPARFGVRAMYLLNSTAGTATCGDIDLLIHFEGSAAQRSKLVLWLEGWSLCLSEQEYLRTGCTSDGLLRVRLVTDDDIRARTGVAAKIDAVTDPALPLPLAGKRS